MGEVVERGLIGPVVSSDTYVLGAAAVPTDLVPSRAVALFGPSEKALRSIADSGHRKTVPVSNASSLRQPEFGRGVEAINRNLVREPMRANPATSSSRVRSMLACHHD